MKKCVGKNKGNGKKQKWVWKILSGVLVVLGIIVFPIANGNVKAMNRCIDAVLKELEEHYTVTKLEIGEYSEMKLFGLMKFDVEQYQIEQLGNLSVMRVNMGLMQMATVVITPKDKNLPLLSADYMYILSNRKCYLEFYDVVKEKDDRYMQLLSALSDVIGQYEHLENIEVAPAWYQSLLTVTTYKAGKTSMDADLEKMLIDNLHTYLEQSQQFPLLTEEERVEKQNITLDYTDGLIENGGISTDVFKKALGDEETKKFFDQVFFGTARE